jgi:carboxyl-terminal processing protease
LHAWVDKLRGVFDQQLGIASGAVVTPTLCWSACSQAVFENGAVLRPADTLAAELGRRAGTFAATWGAPALFVAHQARKRMFPELDDFAWAEIILAAAFRSYVLLIDPHGAWAPFDEETSLYEVELEATGRHRLWSRMSRTAVGVRVDEDPVQPLRTGDVVITIDDVATAGLTVEQVEQLAVLDPADAPAERTIMVLRAEAAPLATLRVSPRPAAEPQQARVAPLQAERVAYRDGEVVVLNIEDVPDDLGEQLADTLLAARRRGKVTGLLLDLRGNGGGSIDGAKGAIGLFLPGAPLFPMRRRSGEIEVEIAPVPRATDRWKGPLAVLVDAETASAAEMIAGALRAYRRAIVLGARTFGKGCAQEYMDDDAGVGVLRLSTLVYALPDGSPVQRTGLVPDIPLDMGPTPDREDALPHAMRPWRGPDVRPKASATPVAWPSHAGRVGGCTDELVCRVLRALGTPRPASARWSPR